RLPPSASGPRLRRALSRRLLTPGPPPGAHRTAAFAPGIRRGTKPLRTPRLDKERPTRDLGTALDDPPRTDLEEMPVDHGNEGLKRVPRSLCAPTLHQVGEDPQEMGINDSAPNVPGIGPPLLRAVQRRRPADDDPRLIPDRRDDERRPAGQLRRLRDLPGA